MFGNFGSLYRCAAAHNITREMEEEEERKKNTLNEGAGAIAAARVERVVYGCPDPKGGAAGSVLDVFASAAVNHRVAVTPGVLEKETAAQLRAFFAARR